MVSKKDYSGCAAISLYPVQKECTEGSCSTNAWELKSEYVYLFFLIEFISCEHPNLTDKEDYIAAVPV